VEAPSEDNDVPPIIKDLTDSVRSLQREMADMQQAVRELGRQVTPSYDRIINELQVNMTEMSRKQNHTYSVLLQVQRDLEVLKQRLQVIEGAVGDDIPVTTAAPRPDRIPSERPPFPRYCTPTERDYEGPFYKPGSPLLDLVCPNDNRINDDLLTVYGYVATSSCRPVANATIEVWQADSASNYVDDCRGYVVTQADGFYRFSTVMPGIYHPRPKHIHLRVTIGRRVELITQVYFEGTNPPGRLRSNTVPLQRVNDNHQMSQFNVILQE